MTLVADSGQQREAIRLAESVELFGFRSRLIEKLEQSDYRNALMLVRRALNGEQEQYATYFTSRPAEQERELRGQLLRLLDMVNSMRLQVRTRCTRDAHNANN